MEVILSCLYKWIHILQRYNDKPKIKSISTPPPHPGNSCYCLDWILPYLFLCSQIQQVCIQVYQWLVFWAWVFHWNGITLQHLSLPFDHLSRSSPRGMGLYLFDCFTPGYPQLSVFEIMPFLWPGFFFFFKSVIKCGFIPDDHQFGLLNLTQQASITQESWVIDVPSLWPFWLWLHAGCGPWLSPVVSCCESGPGLRPPSHQIQSSLPGSPWSLNMQEEQRKHPGLMHWENSSDEAKQANSQMCAPYTHIGWLGSTQAACRTEAQQQAGLVVDNPLWNCLS